MLDERECWSAGPGRMRGFGWADKSTSSEVRQFRVPRAVSCGGIEN